VLVLARKTDEAILIGENIEVKVISIEKGVVKLGIEAPNDVSIIRDELAKDVEKTNKEALKHSNSSGLSKLTSMLKK
jgi:carbon storage regulator CsrA